MTMILDSAPSITTPIKTLVLFDDTVGRTVHWAPRIWKPFVVDGKPAVSLYLDKEEDLAYLSVIMAPWYDDAEFRALAQELAQRNRSFFQVKYLGKNDSGKLGASLRLLHTLFDDERFRFKINGGEAGTMGNPVPFMISGSYKLGRVLKGILQAGPVGLLFQIGYVIRAASSTFEADITIDYDRSYEVLQARASWDWWFWSGDYQYAWQELTTRGAVTVNILGGTPDQKVMVYRTMETVRDLLFKPELSAVTAPSHPSGGIIKTSLRYERQHEHKHFTIQFREREFVDVPDICAAFSGVIDAGVTELKQSDVHTRALLRSAVAAGSRVDADFISLDYIRAAARYAPLVAEWDRELDAAAKNAKS